MSESPLTFYWSAEIEVSAVSLLWHEPKRVDDFLRELDPLVHLSQPHLRSIVQAIAIVYSEIGEVDFACVVTVLREQGRFADCGGLAGLSQVYGDQEYGGTDPARTDKIFAEYLRMLKAYAAARTAEPPRNFYRFLGGRTTLNKNKIRRSQRDPDFVGDATLNGKHFQARAWLSSSQEWINLELYPIER